MHLGPRETVHGQAIYWPTRRGEARFDRLRIWTTFPFGIIKKSITISQPQHTLIYPLLYELRRDLLRSIDPQGYAGSRTSPRTGPGDEYYGMREYRPGDSMRQIAWKRSACPDKLVCLERTRPTPPRVRIIVNLTTPTGQLPVEGGAEQARGLEESGLSLAASVIRAADSRGYEIGLSLPGTGRPNLLVRRSHWYRAKMMSALAAIDLDAPRNEAGPSPATQGERASQIVIHPDRVDPALGRDDAMHLSVRQMSDLVLAPIGWDPNEPVSAPETDEAEEAAA